MVDTDDILRTSRDLAEALHFPPFIGPERESRPLNSTPYMAHINDVKEGRFLSSRKPFVMELDLGLDLLRACNVTPLAALLGGSAIGPKANPSDLDCVVFYKSTPGSSVDASALKDVQLKLREKKLDVRCIPTDGDILILIKVVSFFTTLYCKNYGSLRIERGLVLLDLR